MTENKIGTLRSVDIREVWKDEAKEFTPWLLNNVRNLSRELGLDLELHQAEHPVGKFSLDLIGVVEGTQSRVIIENQLEVSDHSHFGQLLTYAGGTDAKYVIWIAKKFRDEYIAALEWLNQGTTDEINFFAVEVSAVQIDDSLPAPMFKVVVQPNEWSKDTKASANATLNGERAQLQTVFWTKFLSKVEELHPDWTSSKKGPGQNWFRMSTRRISGSSYCLSFTGTEIKSELIFDSGDSELNLKRFEELQNSKLELEAKYGKELVWHSAKIQSIIRDVTPGDFMDEESWDSAIQWMIESQVRLRQVADPYLDALKKVSSD
jgi:hypothetical protein